MNKLQIKQTALSRLVADASNARTHDERNLAAIKASLSVHGQVEPLIVQRSSMRVLGGNGRLQVMRELGWKDAAVVFVDIDDAEAKALAIRLNRTAELASWDPEQLSSILSELSEGQDEALESLGFTDGELEALLEALGDLDDVAAGEEDTEAPEVGAHAVTSEVVDLVIPMATADRAFAYATLRAAKERYKVDSSGLALIEILKAWTEAMP